MSSSDESGSSSSSSSGSSSSSEDEIENVSNKIHVQYILLILHLATYVQLYDGKTKSPQHTCALPSL